MISYIRHRSSTDQLCLRVQVQWSQKVSKRWYLKSDCKDTRQTGGEGHLRTKEMKTNDATRVLHAIQNSIKWQRREKAGTEGWRWPIEKQRSTHPSPQRPVFCACLSSAPKTAPRPQRWEKREDGGRHMGKGSQGTHQLTRRAWPPLPNMFSNSSLSTLTLTP